MGEAIRLLSMHPTRYEAAATEFLHAVITEAAQPSSSFVADPLAMTVQERTFLVCHYLATMSEEGDFAVGDDARYSDYLHVGRDFPLEPAISLGGIAGATWTLHPLLGAHAEAIERLQLEDPASSRFHWVTGAMAAQLRKADERAPDAVIAHAEFLDWLRSRMAWMKLLAESDYAELFGAYWIANQQAAHFFQIDFDRHGVLCQPVNEPSEGAGVAPARFPALSNIGAVAVGLSGKSHVDGG
ncbi:hypothetical protein [Nevskia sp.]|uniref:hypothetical protein n=1 Tax=Nevskia sp. TaxID=1929292 RepID=UPI0025F37AC1|nr:hypothetical protein [Nevskia sp.]